MTPRVVIAQTGHSGSGFIARLLSSLGAKAGHENWFTPIPQRRIPTLDVDSSAFASNHLTTYPGVIWHQTRHPLKVVESIATTSPWTPTSIWYKARQAQCRPFTGDPLTDSVITYVDITNTIRRWAVLHWRVEDMTPQLAIDLMRRMGYTVDPDAAEAAIDEATGTNKHMTTPHTLDWSDLPDHPATLELHALADRYGYH